MEMNEKKNWEKPELEMLAQGKPEEAVLAACKNGNVQGPQDAARGKPNGCYEIDNFTLCSQNVQS